jgi:hypothetical protein
VVFLGLTALFLADIFGHPPPKQAVPLVDPSFLDQTAWRQSYADLVKAKEDLSDFDCYGCHEKNKPPPITFDDKHNIILPKEHANIKLEHGSHNRNNHCYNCHYENNLLAFHVRDGRDLKFQESSQLCGSCHGPTYRDWEAGVHGRTNGYWDRSKGEAHRLDCVNCHDPHSPHIPTREAAPGPRPLRPDPHTAKPRPSSH